MRQHRLQVARGRNPWAYWAYEFLDTEANHRPRPAWVRRILPIASPAPSTKSRA